MLRIAISKEAAEIIRTPGSFIGNYAEYVIIDIDKHYVDFVATVTTAQQVVNLKVPYVSITNTASKRLDKFRATYKLTSNAWDALQSVAASRINAIIKKQGD